MNYAYIVSGLSVGLLVGLTGLGGGSLMTPLLVFLFGFAPTTAVGTDLAHAIPLTLVAGLGHLHMGNVDFLLLGSLLIGSLPGHLGREPPERQDPGIFSQAPAGFRFNVHRGEIRLANARMILKYDPT